MRQTVFVFAWALALASAPAIANAAVLTLVSVQRDLDPLSDQFRAEQDQLKFPITQREPGLVVGNFQRPGDLQTARAYAALFRDRAPVTINLQQNLNGFSAPAFNAVLSDAENVIVANAKFLRLKHWQPFEFIATVSKLVTTMIRYSKVETWEWFQFKRVRVLGGVSRNTPLDNVLLSHFYLQDYYAEVVYTRKFMELYAPGSHRPAWLLLKNISPWQTDESLRDQIAYQSRRSPSVPIIMVLDHGRVYTFAQGVQSSEDLCECERNFAENDRKTGPE